MEQFLNIIVNKANLITIVISVIALIQSNKQTKLSNKQNLFNERLHSYLILKGLIELYKNNKEHMLKVKRDKIYFACNFDFLCLINNSYLENMGDSIKSPLQTMEQKVFLRKIEEMKNESERIKFIFDKNEANSLNEFVNSYIKVLEELYYYLVLLQTMEEIKSTDIKQRDVEEIAKDVDEEKYRNKLFKEIDCLENRYNEVVKKDVLHKIEKQIKLK